MGTSVNTLREKLHHYIDQVEDKKIKAIYTIVQSDIKEEEATELTPAQKKELDKRLADHKSGKLSYHTIDEVRKAVLKAVKK